jgi:hypothetical protein
MTGTTRIKLPEKPAVGEVIENLLQAPQVHHILGQTATAVGAHGDDERRSLRETVGAVELAKGLDEGRPFDHESRRDNPAGEKPQTRPAETADQIL